MSLELSSAGRYEIIEKIGAGGMGSVYRAKDPVIGRAVAVKAIAFADVPDPKERREMQIRTAREARSAGMLSHPNIVTVHDIGQESGLAYIVMELVEGCTLWELFCKRGRLGKTEFLNILRQSAAALDYAHKHGVIHRDVKPSNILVRADGVAKLTDFGVAKILAAEQLTRTGLVVGTPNYMAPEQIKEQNVTAASDQFGLAVIAYELATGVKPFDGGTFSSLLFKIMSEPPRRPSELNPRLPSAAENVLSKALSKEPESRYASCGEFVAALEEACATLPEDALGSRKQPEETAAPESAESSVARLSLDQLRKVESTRASSFQAPAPPEPQPKSRRTLVIAGMVGAAALLALIVGLSLTGGDDAEPERESAAPAAVVETPIAPPPTPTPEAPAQEAPQTGASVSTAPVVAQPKAQPKATQTNTPATAAPSQPAAGVATALDAPLLVGATTTIVWSGELDVGAELRIDGDTASVGEISRGLPGGPVQIEVSPKVLEVLEAPSEANGWKRLRLKNGGDSPRRYFLIRCRAL